MLFGKKKQELQQQAAPQEGAGTIAPMWHVLRYINDRGPQTEQMLASAFPRDKFDISHILKSVTGPQSRYATQNKDGTYALTGEGQRVLRIAFPGVIIRPVQVLPEPGSAPVTAQAAPRPAYTPTVGASSPGLAAYRGAYRVK